MQPGPLNTMALKLHCAPLRVPRCIYLVELVTAVEAVSHMIASGIAAKKNVRSVSFKHD